MPDGFCTGAAGYTSTGEGEDGGIGAGAGTGVGFGRGVLLSLSLLLPGGVAAKGLTGTRGSTLNWGCGLLGIRAGGIVASAAASLS